MGGLNENRRACFYFDCVFSHMGDWFTTLVVERGVRATNTGSERWGARNLLSIGHVVALT